MFDLYKSLINISISTGFTNFEPLQITLNDFPKVLHSKLCYSAGTFKNNLRSSATWQPGQQIIILDFDEGFTEQYFELFDNYIGWIAPTKSYMKEKNNLIVPRYRVVLLLDKPLNVSIKEYRNIHKNIIKDLKVNADKSCVDAARFYYGSPDNTHLTRKLNGSKLFSWSNYNYDELRFVNFNLTPNIIDVSKYSHIDISFIDNLHRSRRYQCPLCAEQGLDLRKHHLGFETDRSIISCFFDEDHSKILRKMYYNYIYGITPESENLDMGKPKCLDEHIPIIERQPKPTNYNDRFIQSIDAVLTILEQSSAIFLDIETYSPYQVNGTEDEVKALLKDYGYVSAAYKRVVKSFSKVALDPFKNKIRLITLGNGSGEGKVTFPFDLAILSKEQEQRVVNIIKSKFIVGQNLKFDFSTLAVKYGFDALPQYCFDTMIADQLHYNATDFDKFNIGSSLGSLAIKHAGRVIEKDQGASDWGEDNLSSEQIKYAVEDVNILYEIYPVLFKKLKEEYFYFDHSSYDINELRFLGPLVDSLHPIIALEMQFLLELVRIELTGIKPNAQFLENTANMYKQEVENAERDLGINPKSAPQCLEFLKKYVDPNIQSSSASVLRLYEGNPYTTKIMKAKSLSTRRGLMSAMLNVADYDNRLHASFKQILVTGRMSCKNPNMQQIPGNIKTFIYEAPKNKVVFDADYPAIELRLMCIFVKDKSMLEAYANNIDLHKLTASKIYNKCVDEINKDERTIAKYVNFGFIYGMMAETFCSSSKAKSGVEFSLEEAIKFRNAFFELYKDIYMLVETTFDEFMNGVNLPRLVYFKDGTQKIVANSYYKKVKTLLGRVTCVDSPNKALNSPIQGSGADMVKLAVCKYSLECRQQNIDAQVINIIHDDVVVEASINQEDAALALFIDNMNFAANYVLQRKFFTDVTPECEMLSRDGKLLVELPEDLQIQDDFSEEDSIDE